MSGINFRSDDTFNLIIPFAKFFIHKCKVKKIIPLFHFFKHTFKIYKYNSKVCPTIIHDQPASLQNSGGTIGFFRWCFPFSFC